MVTLGRPRRGCYKLVWLHSLWVLSSVIDMGECVDHAWMSVVCGALTLAFHVIFSLHHIYHGSSEVIMRKLMLVYGMHRHGYMTTYKNIGSLITSLYVGLHSWLFDYMHQSCRLIIRIDRLCLTICGYAYV